MVNALMLVVLKMGVAVVRARRKAGSHNRLTLA